MKVGFVVALVAVNVSVELRQQNVSPSNDVPKIIWQVKKDVKWVGC